jgi:hypothetical protein
MINQIKMHLSLVNAIIQMIFIIKFNFIIIRFSLFIRQNVCFIIHQEKSLFLISLTL